MSPPLTALTNRLEAAIRGGLSRRALASLGRGCRRGSECGGGECGTKGQECGLSGAVGFHSRGGVTDILIRSRRPPFFFFLSFLISSLTQQLLYSVESWPNYRSVSCFLSSSDCSRDLLSLHSLLFLSAVRRHALFARCWLSARRIPPAHYREPSPLSPVAGVLEFFPAPLIPLSTIAARTEGECKGREGG